MAELSKRELRADLRARRRALTVLEQNNASLAMRAAMGRLPAFMQAKRIAMYLAADGEVDLMPTMRFAHRLGKQVYLPLPYRGRRNICRFAQWQPNGVLKRGKYDIPVPDEPWRFALKANQLDLILMPLVGFDDSNNRLGMGGGFYDRTLEPIACRSYVGHPHLLGVAHRCQKSDEPLPVEPWDIPLPDIIAV